MEAIRVAIVLLFSPLAIILTINGVNVIWPLNEIKKQIINNESLATLNFLKVTALVYLSVIGVTFILNILMGGGNLSFKEKVFTAGFFVLCYPLFCLGIYLYSF